MDEPLGVTALLDADGRLLPDLPTVVAAGDVVLGEFLDEELGLAVGQRTPVPARQHGASAGPDAWEVARAVARRHAMAFGYADHGLWAPEYGIVADLVDPDRMYVELHVGDDDTSLQAFVVRADGTVLHDHVDLDDHLHLVVLRDGARARDLLTTTLADVRHDRAPRTLVLHEGGEPPRGMRFTATPEGIALSRGHAPPRHLDHADVAAVVADLLR